MELPLDLMRSSLRIGLLTVFALASGHLNAQVPIPIVRTWGDLQNAPKLTVVPSPRVEKGETLLVLPPITFQVGIQNDEADSYSGLVLYFLAPTSAVGENTPNSLGLYSWEVVGKDPARRFPDTSYAFPRRQPETENGYTFYAE